MKLDIASYQSSSENDLSRKVVIHTELSVIRNFLQIQLSLFIQIIYHLGFNGNMSDSTQLYQVLVKYPLFFYAFISKYYPLTESHLSLLENELSWGLVALNEEIEFSIELIEKYSEKLNKEDLGYNRKVNQSNDIMKHFRLKPRTYWQELFGELSDSEEDQSADKYHPSIRYHEYSLEEIEKNIRDIQWNHFSSNELINWNYNLISKYKDYLWFGSQEDQDTLTTDGLELYNNETVPWDVKLIQLFADKVLTHKEVVKQFMFNETMVKNIQPQFNEALFTIVLTELKF